MNNVVRHSGVPSQTKDHRTVSLLCMFMSCSQHSFYFLYNTPQINSALVLPHLFTLNPIFTLNSLPALPLHLLSPFFFLCLQARRPSRPSGLSPGTSLCEWESQLRWGVKCCGPQGLCSGWKMASSWDLREVCRAFHATAWLETPREVNRHGIRSMVDWTFMDLSLLNKWTWEKHH